MGVHNSNSPNIVAENLQVRYTANTNDPDQRRRGLKRISGAILGRNGTTTVRALRGVNLVAREGEMVGIVGANGSGKSTLLRNIAGVEQPDRGRILVRYQPLLLGVSAALQPALSGSENVRLGCLAMGLTPEEAEEAFAYVAELSALGQAIHRPMGTYSSGMGARLRFAIALAARPKILLIDEALSTGDATFADRSEKAMDELLTETGTVLLVNHAAKVIQELCSRAVWMHKGEILMDGPAEAVAEKYRWWAWNVAKGKEDIADKLLQDVIRNAIRDEINVLEPELIKNPIPRHAIRGGRSRLFARRHVDYGRTPEDSVEATSTPQLASAQPTVWSDESFKGSSKAKYPTLPKPASEVRRGATVRDEEPLRLRPSNHMVVLRAANPNDRASTIATRDLTGRRLATGSGHSAWNRRQDDRNDEKKSALNGSDAVAQRDTEEPRR